MFGDTSVPAATAALRKAYLSPLSRACRMGSTRSVSARLTMWFKSPAGRTDALTAFAALPDSISTIFNTVSDRSETFSSSALITSDCDDTSELLLGVPGATLPLDGALPGAGKAAANVDGVELPELDEDDPDEDELDGDETLSSTTPLPSISVALVDSAGTPLIGVVGPELGAGVGVPPPIVVVPPSTGAVEPPATAEVVAFNAVVSARACEPVGGVGVDVVVSAELGAEEAESRLPSNCISKSFAAVGSFPIWSTATPTAC